jgi:hypothetical protein
VNLLDRTEVSITLHNVLLVVEAPYNLLSHKCGAKTWHCSYRLRDDYMHGLQWRHGGCCTAPSAPQQTAGGEDVGAAGKHHGGCNVRKTE